MLGSDGTVSIWDKDARTRMKSKPTLLAPLSSPWIRFPRPASPRRGPLFIRHSSLVTHSFCSPHLSPSPLESTANVTTFFPYMLVFLIYQHSMPYRARLSARPSTTRGRCSLMRLRMTGRKDMRGMCPRSGTRCCYMGVRRMKLGNDHPSPGWVTSDLPVTRCFLGLSCPFYASSPCVLVLVHPLYRFFLSSLSPFLVFVFFCYTICMDPLTTTPVTFRSRCCQILSLCTFEIPQSRLRYLISGYKVMKFLGLNMGEGP